MPDFSFLDETPPPSGAAPSPRPVRSVVRTTRPRSSFKTGFGGAFGCLSAVLVFGLLLILGSVAIREVGKARLTPTGTPNGDKHPTDLVVSDAAAVFAAYEHNEIKADNDLKGKWFAVRGTVEQVGKDIVGTPYVALSNGKRFGCVQCIFTKADEEVLAGFSPGQTLVIAGQCSGKMGNVLMRDCWLYDKHIDLPQRR